MGSGAAWVVRSSPRRPARPRQLRRVDCVVDTGPRSQSKLRAFNGLRAGLGTHPFRHQALQVPLSIRILLWARISPHITTHSFFATGWVGKLESGAVVLLSERSHCPLNRMKGFSSPLFPRREPEIIPPDRTEPRSGDKCGHLFYFDRHISNLFTYCLA